MALSCRWRSRPQHQERTWRPKRTPSVPGPEAAGDASKKSFSGVGAGPSRSSFGEAATDEGGETAGRASHKGGYDAVEGLIGIRNENPDDRSHVRQVPTLARRPFLVSDWVA